MKKILLLSLLVLFGLAVQAQQSASLRTIIVKAATEQQFIVYLNGHRQNAKPQSLVEIKNLADAEYQVSVKVVSPKLKQSKQQMNVRTNGAVVELEVGASNNRATLTHAATCGIKSQCQHQCNGQNQRHCSGCSHHH